MYKKAALDVVLQEIIETRAVRKLCHPWAFATVLAPKKDITASLCVNFLELSGIVVRD